MSNTVNIVTGAAGFVGRALVIKLIEDGETVIGLDRFPARGLRQHYEHLDVDLTSERSLDEAIDHIESRNTCIKRLVHCAGIYERKGISELSYKDIEKAMKVNCISFMYLTTRLAIFLKCGPSYVVAMSSDAAFLGPKEGVHYAGSKGAVVSAVFALARAFGNKEILVNCIVPGVIDSPQAQTNRPERREKFESQIPLGRLAQASDIVSVIMSLTSGQFDYCTGQKIIINGGRNLL